MQPPLKGPEVPEGTQLGSYRIETRIGDGGMGVVYLAFDSKLGRPAAIKFLTEEGIDSAARRRFQREAHTASSLNHPHILTVYDVGEIDGRQYLVVPASGQAPPPVKAPIAEGPQPEPITGPLGYVAYALPVK